MVEPSDMPDHYSYQDFRQSSASASTAKKPKLYTFLPSKEEEDKINK